MVSLPAILKYSVSGYGWAELNIQRGALFRRGDLDIGDFTASDGRTYSIDELRRLRPLAFERANIH